jgi:hypothetical protein
MVSKIIVAEVANITRFPRIKKKQWIDIQSSSILASILVCFTIGFYKIC